MLGKLRPSPILPFWVYPFSENQTQYHVLQIADVDLARLYLLVELSHNDHTVVHTMAGKLFLYHSFKKK
jgi:hypothetical protein